MTKGTTIMTTLKAQADFMFKKNFLIGTAVLFVGFIYPFGALPVYSLLLLSLGGGFVLGSCYRLMVQNSVFSSIQFYEHMLKFEIEADSSINWDLLLAKRFGLTLICLLLCGAVLSLPILLDLTQGKWTTIYLIIVLLKYSRLPRFAVVQIKSWKAIKARILGIEGIEPH